MRRKPVHVMTGAMVALTLLGGSAAASLVAAGPAQAAETCTRDPTGGSTLCATDISATAGEEFFGTIATYSGIDFTIIVDWGDGANDTYPAGGIGTIEARHLYLAPGTYAINVIASSAHLVATSVATVTEPSPPPPSADLSVTLNAPSSAAKGSPLIYQILPSNAGPDAASNVVLTDRLPYGTAFQSVTASDGWSCYSPKKGTLGATITCTRSQLLVGEATAVSTGVTIKALPGRGPVTNAVTISSNTIDPTPANNTASVSTSISR